jgi:glycosyltransferase involved in cell wall biosynthesis
MFNPCIVIPVYNHEAFIGITLSAIEQYMLPCILINDGSNSECQLLLEQFAEQHKWVHLESHHINRGKGAAIKTGLRRALRSGFTHALQIDADGQHNLEDIPLFLSTAQKNPDAIIAGHPIFDETIPKLRLYARYLTHVLVWISTLSTSIRDSMCGFRVYPLDRTVDLINKVYLGNRMDFDVEILVKSQWNNISILSIPTKVSYPKNGISHFKLFHDNFLITIMHTRLLFGMLIRLPGLLINTVKKVLNRGE